MPNKVPATVTNKMPPIKTPLRKPMKMSRVPTTITNANTTFITKSSMEVLTDVD